MAAVLVGVPAVLLKTASYSSPFSARAGREAVGGRGRAGDGAEGRAAVGAHFPLHAGRGIAAGRGREGRRVARTTVWLAGFGSRPGRSLTVSVAAVVVAARAVAEDRLVLVAVFRGLAVKL